MNICETTIKCLYDKLDHEIEEVRKEEARLLIWRNTLDAMIKKYTESEETQHQISLFVEDNPPARGMETEFYINLGKTYYEHGFFNVPVKSDGAIPTELEYCDLVLTNGVKIQARVHRNQNPNGTARVMGAVALKYWFQENYSEGDRVPAVIAGGGSTIILGREPSSVCRPMTDDSGSYLSRTLLLVN